MNHHTSAPYPTFATVSTEEFKLHVLPLKNKLYRFAFGMLQREDEAKDVVQEVMIKSWKEIKDVTAIRNMEAWCMTLTKNKSLDRLRKKGRNYLDISEQVDLVSQEQTPLEATTQTETRRIVLHAISSLPTNQKEVVLLRDIEGYSNKEIAELLNVSENNVRILLHRGRLKLKEQLESIYRKKAIR